MSLFYSGQMALANNAVQQENSIRKCTYGLFWKSFATSPVLWFRLGDLWRKKQASGRGNNSEGQMPYKNT